jgi:hypothetical protein
MDMPADDPVRRPWSRPGPFAAFRDRYVAAYAGVSYDLAPGAVGVDPDFLQNAPDLAGRLVLVSHDARAARRIVQRPTFLVVALDRLMRNALGAAALGGVVFSTFDLEDPARGTVLEGLDPGDSVYLNAAVDRLPDVNVRRPFRDDAAS